METKEGTAPPIAWAESCSFPSPALLNAPDLSCQVNDAHSKLHRQRQTLSSSNRPNTSLELGSLPALGLQIKGEWGQRR